MIPTSKKVKDQVFAFDRVFDENISQTEVYEGTTKNLLKSVLDGYNATVFAYGATGCGKTHTITGTSQHPGIIFLTMQELFEKIEERSQEKTTELSLSYLEIYNETIRDLLLPGGSKTGLTLREDSNQAVTVAGLTSHHPKDVQEVMDMIVQGNGYRTVSPTEANATSSRSHAVLQINVAQKDRNADINEPHTMATLSIIDLAGSERASVTKNRGERLTEGANINKSLLALGSCINALCDRRQRAHVPYRNSKLTRLLKFSLGGNCKTVMIVCVSPSSVHFDETQNTLRYANRAKNIQTKVTRNVFNVNRHVKDFLVKIDEQMALINELKAQQKDAEKLFFAKFRKQCEKREHVARDGIQRLRAAYDNAAAERQERIASMRKLKAFERRISLLTGWIAAFDAVCEQRVDQESMPPGLAAVKKMAQGILVELESSRHHIHQKLERPVWERAIDTALTHSLAQLEEIEGADTGETSSLVREAELLKANFNREAYREVLEQEKAGDAAMMQMLLTAQFDMLASLSDLLASGEEGCALAQAKASIEALLQAGLAASSQVVKPDGSLPVVEMFPPTRRGTPKRKKSAGSYIRPMVTPVLAAVQNEHVFASPMRSSPRRRKVLGAAKKGVTFTPAKKTIKSRGVRWRDDETEAGTLADFEKTPQPLADPSPESIKTDELMPVMKETGLAASDDLQAGLVDDPASSIAQETKLGSTASEVPVQRTSSASKLSRFQAGFLSKSSKSSRASGLAGGSEEEEGSPMLSRPVLSLKLASSSPDSDRATPLRALDAAKAGNLSPPVAASRQQQQQQPQQQRREKPPPEMRGLAAVEDENTPLGPKKSADESASSDSDCGSIDARKIRSAMQSIKKDKSRRLSALTAAASSGKRTPSGGPGGDRPGPRPSISMAASTANGISRFRRGSLERKRSPPLTCSPSEAKSDRGLTAGQARRMIMGGSLRMGPPGGSPRGTAADAARRATISVAATPAAQRRQEVKSSASLR